MFATRRWNGHVEGHDDSERGDGRRTPQFAILSRAQVVARASGVGCTGCWAGVTYTVASFFAFEWGLFNERVRYFRVSPIFHFLLSRVITLFFRLT
jgi:hypothetical protein